MELPLTDAERAWLKGFDVFPDEAAADRYLYDAWERMQVVLAWLRDLEARGARSVLELGANPYYLTLLMKRHFPFELELANYFGEVDGAGVGERGVQVLCGGGGERHELPFAHFNVETEPFPYPDGAFHLVLFSEILEHLVLAPDHTVGECRRVLKPGGHLIVTSPNAARLGNLIRLLKGQNVADGYSKHGVYGRHNREHTLGEVRELVLRHGFRVEREEVRNIYPHPLRSRLIQALRPNVWREHLFVLAAR